MTDNEEKEIDLFAIDKICYKDTVYHRNQLRLKLKELGLKSTHFFRAVAAGLVAGDKDIMNFIDKIPTNIRKQSKTKRKFIRRDLNKQDEVKADFDLDETEIKDIFDFIEKEGPLT